MNNFKHSVIAALLLASPLVGADTQYPAADFEPKVLYKDADYKASPSASTESTSKKSSSAASDSQYPATDFQPKVLYKDDNYKSSASSVSSSSAAPSRPKVDSLDESQAASSSSSAAAAAPAESGSKPNYLIILVVLGIIGFVFYKNKPKKCASKSGNTSGTAYKNSGLTGVAKYVNRVSGTGVARYLEKHVKAAPAATGVAKYVAKQVITAKTTAESAATGVEKYVRNRR